MVLLFHKIAHQEMRVEITDLVSTRGSNMKGGVVKYDLDTAKHNRRRFFFIYRTLSLYENHHKQHFLPWNYSAFKELLG